MNVLLVNPYIYDFTAYDLWLRPLGLLYIASILKKYSDCDLHWLDLLDRSHTMADEEKKTAPPSPQAHKLPPLPGFQARMTQVRPFGPPGGPPEGHRRSEKRDTGRGKYHQERVDKPALYSETPRYYSRFGMPYDVFREKVERLPEMDLILVTTLMTYWVEGVRFTLEHLRRRFPNARIVLGGIIPTLVEQEDLKGVLDADYYIRGYGENRVLEVVKDNGGTVFAHPDLSDIRNLPYPAVEYLGDPFSLPLLTSRGCPFHCTYCASDRLNPGFIERDAGAVLDEIFYMHETHGTRHFAVFDDALLINKRKRFFKIFEPVSRQLALSFHTPNGLHAGEMDEETARVFFESGFQMVRLSFESTSRAILSKSGDKVTVSQMVRAVENLEAAGYRRHDIGVYLLCGLPGQPLEAIHEALDFTASLGVKQHLCYFTPVPGTPDFAALQQQGVISSPTNLLETNKVFFLYNKSGFTFEEVKRLKDKAARHNNRCAQ